MNLFGYDPSLNLLPDDGEVNYFGSIFTNQQLQHYLHYLLNNINWENDELIIYAKHITTKRKVAWYGDSNYAYTYSNTTKQALPWTTELLTLKTTVEKLTQTRYNSCLLNLYQNGEESMSWHSDDEVCIDKNGAIASLSFGAERKFSLKHKTSKKTISLILESGGLLVMKGTTQTHWLHSLPKMKNVSSPRVNLTFRRFTQK
jgi:alkylated DNA repair dioxygenase AlkB